MCYFHKILRGNFFQQQISLIQYLTIVKIMLSQRKKKIIKKMNFKKHKIIFFLYKSTFYNIILIS